MKKLFTFLLLGCAAITTVNAQQLPNNSFEEWKGEGNCGNTYQSSSSGTGNTPAGERKRPGDEPAGWNGSNVNQKVIMEASKPGYVSKGTGKDGSTCVKLTNLWVGVEFLKIGDEAPAYITFGTPWVYAVTSLDDCDGGTYGGMEFTYRPDAIKGQYKRTPATTAENAHIIAYLWKGTFVSAIPSVGNVTKEDVDRAILGKTEATTSGTLIASCDYEFATTTNNDWQEIIVPLEYVEGQENTIPEKMNVIISSADYWTRGNIQENSILEVDNVEFVYYSQLQSLSYNGTPVKNFDKNNYEYRIDATYDASKLEAKADGVGATIDQKYDKGTGKLTITVMGNDWKETQNQHVYTIQFAVTKDYKNDLSVGINGQYTEPQETTIQLIEQVDGTYSFVLKNFYFTTMPVGNIQLDNLTLTDGKISATQGIAITNGDDPNVEWAGPDLTIIAGGSIPVELEATVYDNENMTAEIAIDMTSVLGQMINVTFAPSFTLNSGTSIGEETSNLYNVEFNRSFPAGWSTICLPFATTVEALGATQAQEFTDFANNTLEFTKVSTGKLAANTPYLIHFEQAKDLSAAPIYAPMTVESSTPKAVTFGDVTFTGNYTAGMSMEGYYGVADQNGSQYIMKGGSNSTLGSTGAYFSVAGAAAEVNRLALDLEGVTAIGSVETEGAEDAFDVYSISGVKVRTGATNLDGLQRGLYIVNGKKVLVK